MGDNTLKKLFVCPYFGALPTWFDKYLQNFEHLKQSGYELLLDTDEEKFKQRVQDKLGLTVAPVYGSRKLSDLRVMFGELYSEELAGFDFWGITDFDCAYGDVSKYISDERLANLDIHSNHYCYICGPWTLFRNCEKINSLFREFPTWQDEVTRESMSGWGEQEYSKIVDAEHGAGRLRRLYTHHQSKDPSNVSGVRFADGKLYDGNTEIMMAHFNRSKIWPEGV